MWVEYRKIRPVKKHGNRKYPKHGQSQKELIVENTKRDLHNEGHILPEKTDKRDEQILTIISQFRNSICRPEFANVAKDRLEIEGFASVAVMWGDMPKNYWRYQDKVKEYCEDHNLDYNAIVKPKEKQS